MPIKKLSVCTLGLVTPLVMAAAKPTTLASPAVAEVPQGRLDRDAPPPPTPTADEEGVEYALNLGIALPLGSIDGGVHSRGGMAAGGGLDRRGALRGVASFAVPVGLDLGYRWTELWLGLHAQAMTGGDGNGCASGADCRWTNVGLGLAATYGIDGAGTGTWLGAILGYEWLRRRAALDRAILAQSLPADGMTLDSSALLDTNAVELLGGPAVGLAMGYAYDIGEAVHVGPYLAGSLGVYLTDSLDCPAAVACSGGPGVDAKRLHAWLGLGVRGSHGP